MSKRLTSGLAVLAAVIPMLGIPTVALALDSSKVDYFAHIAECLSWLVSDPDRHDQFCSPTQVTAAQVEALYYKNGNGTSAPSSESTSSLPPG